MRPWREPDLRPIGPEDPRLSRFVHDQVFAARLRQLLEERKAIEAKYRAEFTAADLQQYTEDLEGVPLEEVIVELKKRQRQLTEKKS